MQHVFDLSDNNYYGFTFFPDAVAAFHVSDVLERNASLLVWGVIVLKPQLHPIFWAQIPDTVRQSAPSSIYLSGWGRLTFDEAQGGQVTVLPYTPVFPPSDLVLTSAVLTKIWPDKLPRNATTEHAFDFVLENPLGYMSIVVRSTGGVSLSVNPSDFVTLDQLHKSPDKYGFDWTRKRQLDNYET